MLQLHSSSGQETSLARLDSSQLGCRRARAGVFRIPGAVTACPANSREEGKSPVLHEQRRARDAYEIVNCGQQHGCLQDTHVARWQQLAVAAESEVRLEEQLSRLKRGAMLVIDPHRTRPC